MRELVACTLKILFLVCLMLAVGCGTESVPQYEAPDIPTASAVVSSKTISAALAPPVDNSLALHEYIDRGVPSQDQTWSSNDIRRAADTLSEIASQNFGELPRFESPKSGAIFARIVADSNLDFFRNRSLPIDQRMPAASQFLKSTNQILKLYTAALTKRVVGGDELVELLGSQLRISVVVFQMVNEHLPTLDKEDPYYQARIDGLNQMRQGTATIIFGCLQTLTESHAYRNSELKRLFGYMQSVFPQLLPELSEADESEVVTRIRKLIVDSRMNNLKSELESLLIVAETEARNA